MNRLQRIGVVWTSLALIIVSLGLASRVAQAQAQTQPHVYLFHGIFAFLSLGMDDIAGKLQRRGIPATVHSFDDWQSVAEQAAAGYQAGTANPIILVGHSLGANSVMKIADYLDKANVPVALIVTFDSTDTYYAPKNVSRLLNFTRYFEMRRGPGFHGSLTNLDLRSDPEITHLNIDRSPKLQAWVINEVLAAVNSHGVAAPRANPKAAALNPAAPRPPGGAASRGSADNPAVLPSR